MGRYFVTSISTNDIHGAVAVAAFGALATAIGAILADVAVVLSTRESGAADEIADVAALLPTTIRSRGTSSCSCYWSPSRSSAASSPLQLHRHRLPGHRFPPGSGHWFGTNDAGNDLYAQVVHGLQRSLIIALAVAVGTTMIAAIAGSLAAFFGGWVEKATMGLIYLLPVVPSFLILAMTANATGGDWRWIIVALIVFGWMMLARVVYSMALSIREREFVIAARYMGSGRGRSSPATSSRTCRRCWSSTSRSRWSARSSPRRGFRSWGWA